MANITQCPNCFTSFEISDAQYNESKGKVRCGTCRETFHAILADTSPESLESFWAQQGTPDISQFNFDPMRGPGDSTDELDVKSGEVRHSEQAFASGTMTGSNASAMGASIPPYVTHDPKEPPLSPSAEKLATSGSTGISADPDLRQSIEENIHSDLTIEMEDEDAPPSSTIPEEGPSDNAVIRNPRSEFAQVELDLASLESALQEQQNGSAVSLAVDDQELIAEVDQLIDNKLLTKQPESGVPGSSDNEPFKIGKQPKSGGLSRWLVTSLWTIAAIILLAGLVYQLWLRQAIPLLENSKTQVMLAPVVTPVLESLSERFNINLSERRHLSQLQLMSARTEAHPTRSSTTLLRISLVNRSEISQPFPWLELSLTDKDGRLVSRRALAPQDYLHNNRLKNEIGARELRSITVELLSFPKIADGYELKLLNK